MRLKSIDIKNYKGFDECKLNFHPKVNIFIGSNASGKTTLLSAIAKTLYNLTSDFVVANHQEEMLRLSMDDIKYQSTFSYIKLSLDILWKKDLETFISEGFYTSEINEQLEKINNVKFDFVLKTERILQSGPITIPIIKFYPADRGNIDYDTDYKTKQYKISQLESWDNIYQTGFSYNKFFNWFFENETNELRLQRDYRDFSAESPDLRDVRRALHETFKLLEYGEFKLISKQISRKHNSKLYPTLVLENLKTGVIEYVDNKSDGEKAIILLVANIAYNLSISKDFTNDDDFLKSPGVVIIDEIETHLHPKWQREIVPILTKIFPNIQYFIATHSPQVVSSVQSESIFICDNFNVESVHFKTFGEDTNSLLNYIFNATDRPKEYAKLLEQFDKLLDTDSSIDAIKKVIDKIQKLYDRDKAPGISNLIEELNIRLSAYQFEREYEKNN